MNRITLAVAGLALTALAGAALAQSAGHVGSWRHQGTQTELVLTSVIKHQPWGGGFVLGGSVGSGSATRAVIVTENQPMTVTRTMRLDIQPDGRFHWVTTKQQPKGEGCIATIDQDRTGRVTVRGSEMSFYFTGGTERVREDCNPRTSESPVTPHTETYPFRLSGGQLSLTSAGTTWTFRR
jgi:hypothetical protein